MIRGIIRSHFEDEFKSPEQVHEVAKELKSLAEQNNATIGVLLEAGASSKEGFERSNTHPITFERVWKVRPNENDTEVSGFCTWSALLLHLMVHKAFGVLFNPLFRDPTMVSDARLRTRFTLTNSNLPFCGMTDQFLSAVKHSQAFLQIFLRVCDDHVSEPFHWMYPGTYQPLQAVALLLADLLQRPWSDEASLSRGLVDAIFDMYHVDEGMLSRSDPPKRNLSSSGKEAWSMLARTRKKALEHIGQDSHVLLPHPLAKSEFCLCGERIAGQNPSPTLGEAQPPHSSHGQWRAISASPINSYPIHENPQDLAIAHDDAIGSIEFSWLEWDASVGSSTGLMP